VINHDVEAGAEAARRITEQFGVQPMDANVSLDEFNAWAQSDRLDGYFDQLT
jgi:hypothetical protein